MFFVQDWFGVSQRNKNIKNLYKWAKLTMKQTQLLVIFCSLEKVFCVNINLKYSFIKSIYKKNKRKIFFSLAQYTSMEI